MDSIVRDYIKQVNTSRFHIALTASLFVTFCYRFFKQYLTIPFVVGWDGTSHASVISYFAEHIYPAIFGWIPLWNLGMPWNIGYPPFYTLFVSTITKLSPLTFTEDFKLVFIIATLSLPILAYLIAFQIHHNRTYSLLSGLLTIAFLLSINNSYLAVAGVTVRTTFQVGLYSQLLATNFLLIWLLCLFNRRTFMRKLAPVCLSLVVLTNLHAAESAFIILFCLTGYRAVKTKAVRLPLKRLLLTILQILGLCAFWLIPFLLTREYLLGFTDSPINLMELLLTNLGIFALGVLAALNAIKNSQELLVAIALSILSIVLVATLPLAQLLPNIPIHPNRLTPIALLLLAILAPYALKRFINSSLLHKLYQIITIILLILPFMNMRSADIVAGGLNDIGNEELAVVNYLNQHNDGLSLIEAWYSSTESDDNGYKYRPLQSQLAGLLTNSQNHQTLWGVFRESSINMPFIQPIRNAFSPLWPEQYGVYCYLCLNKDSSNNQLALDFYSQSIDIQLKRTRYMGVKYYVLRSAEAKTLIEGVQDIQLVQTYGEWYIYRDEADLSPIIIPDKYPVLTFTKIHNTSRGIHEYDWLRLNEEWLYHAETDVVLAHTGSWLDQSYDLSQFKAALVTDYRYHDLGLAYDNLIEFSRTNLLILLSSDNPLFQLLKDHGGNIHVVERTGDVRIDMQRILQLIKALTPDAKKSQPTLVSDDQRIRLTALQPGEPIILRQSYFPWWEGAAKLYLTSPGLTLVIPEQPEVMLEFITNNLQSTIGIYITCITLIITLLIPTKLLKKVARTVMSIKWRKLLRSIAPPLALLLVNLVIAFRYLYSYLSSSSVSGWDGPGHFALTELANGASKVIPYWNLGMPWPAGYTPAFTQLMQLLYQIFFSIERLTIFQFTIVCLALLFPVTVYLSLRATAQGKGLSMISGLLVIIWMTHEVDLKLSDLTYRGIFELGAYPFFVATILYLGLLAILNKGRYWHIAKAILISLIILTNVHVAQVALCIMAVKALLSLYRRHYSIFVFSYLLVPTLTMWWIIPVIENSSYLLTAILPAVKLSEIPPLLLSVLVLGVISIFIKRNIYSLVMLSLLILVFFPFGNYVKLWALQPNRLFALAVLISIMTLPNLTRIAQKKLSSYHYKLICFILCILTLFIGTFITPLRPALTTYNIDQDSQAVINYLKTLPPGRTLVENWGERNNPVSNKLTAELARARIPTLWGTFRESSISMPYIQPVRNAFSQQKESYAITCLLCYQSDNLWPSLVTEFNNSSAHVQLKRARLLGVKYYILHSISSQKLAQETGELTLERDFGNWQIWTDANYDGDIVPVHADPILTYTHLATQNRNANDYDWLRFNEEWLFHGEFEHLFVLAQENNLTSSLDLDRFNITLVSDYIYTDLDETVDRLIEYSRNKQLILFEQNDPLYERLSAAASNDPILNIKLVPRRGSLREEIKQVLGVVASENQAAPHSFGKNTANSRRIDWNELRIEIPTGELTLVKQSYFPHWTSPQGFVYMASPSLILVVPNDQSQ